MLRLLGGICIFVGILFTVLTGVRFAPNWGSVVYGWVPIGLPAIWAFLAFRRRDLVLMSAATVWSFAALIWLQRDPVYLPVPMLYLVSLVLQYLDKPR